MPPDSLAQRVNSIARLTGTFTLRSGQIAAEYFDKYRFEADPAAQAALAQSVRLEFRLRRSHVGQLRRRLFRH